MTWPNTQETHSHSFLASSLSVAHRSTFRSKVEAREGRK
jgi:hypothetical protein